ncbi:MAG: S24/S26 family peptidase [Kiritimatiellae bacterium]|jgi:hypothetical protein|nr:S24/S26 family peptidase [Kiritimatiellia bacterium]
MAAWHKTALAELAKGNDVAVINRGSSMRGLVEDGQVIIISPVSISDIKKGDVALVRIKRGRFLIHLVKDIENSKYLIGNNIGGLDGLGNRRCNLWQGETCHA